MIVHARVDTAVGMSEMIEFFLPMVPPTVTAQEHKVTVANGKPRFYDPPKLSAARSKLTGALAYHRTGYAAQRASEACGQVVLPSEQAFGWPVQGYSAGH